MSVVGVPFKDFLRSYTVFCFRPLIQNKLEVLGKAGLSEDVLEADCTFFKVHASIHLL